MAFVAAEATAELTPAVSSLSLSMLEDEDDAVADVLSAALEAVDFFPPLPSLDFPALSDKNYFAEEYKELSSFADSCNLPRILWRLLSSFSSSFDDALPAATSFRSF